MRIVNQIRWTGEEIPDQRIVEKFLKSLPKKFEMVVTSILESKDLSNFSIDELMGSLLTHETRLHLEDELIANAFKTQFSFNGGRGSGRGHQGRGRSASNHHSSEGHRQHQNHNFQGHRQQNQNKNFQPQRVKGRRSNDKSNIKCYYCKRYGHYGSECWKKQVDQLSGRAHVSNHEGETWDGMFLSCHKTEEQHKDL